MALAGIGRGDDDTDGFLVEAFEAAVALEVFEMAADGAVFDELIELLLCDQFRREEVLGAFLANGPAFAFGEGLAEEFEIGEGLHDVDAVGFELIAQQIEIESGFEMVHAAFEKTFAVKADPEADGAEARSGWKFLRGEIDLGFFGHEIHVSENDDADRGLLGDLRAPAGF